jgi:hypothetical protein
MLYLIHGVIDDMFLPFEIKYLFRFAGGIRKVGQFFKRKAATTPQYFAGTPSFLNPC